MADRKDTWREIGEVGVIGRNEKSRVRVSIVETKYKDAWSRSGFVTKQYLPEDSDNWRNAKGGFMVLQGESMELSNLIAKIDNKLSESSQPSEPEDDAF